MKELPNSGIGSLGSFRQKECQKMKPKMAFLTRQEGFWLRFVGFGGFDLRRELFVACGWLFVVHFHWVRGGMTNDQGPVSKE
ncbi:MAG TPA: hypothetical protein VGP94_10345 [Tepidisphaeraceae bacterium]|nr:hypothetical protein [Tepidisphaeraceae bacterium]